MRETKQFRMMLVVSVIFHIVALGGMMVLYSLRSQGEPIFLSSDVQFVQLYDLAEIPGPVQKTPPPVQEPEVVEELVAVTTPESDDTVVFPDISTIEYAPTPTPFPTPTPALVPTPTPKPLPTRRPTPTPTPTFRPQLAWQEQQPVLLEPPIRRPVIEPYSPKEGLTSVLKQSQSQKTPQPNEQDTGPSSGRQTYSFASRSSSSAPMTFETENEFLYPEYLEHIKEKIEGLWFPEGKGTISIYLIIERNGKILKSGVDKGEGLDVEKLRESVVRALSLIKRFNPLPEDYGGMMLRVRIIVRR